MFGVLRHIGNISALQVFSFNPALKRFWGVLFLRSKGHGAPFITNLTDSV